MYYVANATFHVIVQADSSEPRGQLSLPKQQSPLLPGTAEDTVMLSNPLVILLFETFRAQKVLPSLVSEMLKLPRYSNANGSRGYIYVLETLWTNSSDHLPFLGHFNDINPAGHVSYLKLLRTGSFLV